MHIILLILKIIGWILLVILGLILLMMCVVLFTPLKYQVSARCDGDLSSLAAKADFSLFFYLIRGSVRYIEQQLSWEISLAWKKWSSEPVQEENIQPAGENTSAAKKLQEDVGIKQDVEEDVGTRQDVEKDVGTRQNLEKNAAPVDVKKTAAKEVTVPAADTVSTAKTTSATDTVSNAKTTSGTDTVSQKVTKESVSSKLTAIAEKLKCTCREICDKIKELLRKKDIIMDFLTNVTHKAAFEKLLTEGKKLFRRLMPRQFQADIRFGFEDPAVTGKVLAGISMIYPLICEHTEIHPDFCQQILKGNLFMKGKIRAIIFVAMLWNMLLNANVRRTVMDIKNFKL